MPQILDVVPTDLFVGTAERPRQVVRVLLDPSAPVGARVSVTGDGVGTPEPATLTGQEPGDERHPGSRRVEVGVLTRDVPAGTSLPVRVMLDDEPATGGEAALVVAEPGWTMVMVNHFHYDPVWWNTQAAYASEWDRTWLDGEGQWRAVYRGSGAQESGFALVRAHLDQARRDPDYTFVLAELDYLKPYWDACPADRDELRALLAAGRCEVMGGTYNEPNSNLTAAETTARNLVHGIGFQRDVFGGDPHTAWQLDVFGHDPQFPGMCSDAGLTSSSWARGPFHQWGPVATAGSADVMQFPAEFEWISPSGRGVLTAYMASHYSAGWSLDEATTLEEALDRAYALFRELVPVAAGRTVLLPVGTDYTPPNRWVTQVHRAWNERYLWPRFVCAVPREFFARVREVLGEQGRSPWPQTRDMNPLYTGKDVSFIDTKQAHRAGEHTLMAAERAATLASLLTGAPYPWAGIDKAWRHLLYGAHHDAVTGSESDQVYLDLVTNWREALDVAATVLGAAQRALAARVDTTGPDGGIPVVVHNTLTWQRTDTVRVEVDLDEPGTTGFSVAGAGDGSSAVVVAADRWDDGTLRRAVLQLVVRDVPGLGHRTVHLLPATNGENVLWADADGTTASSDRFSVTADPARGGALTSVLDARSGRELVGTGDVANELVVHGEYSAHPQFHEGPWHLVPDGTRTHGSRTAAQVQRQVSPLGERLVVTGEVGPARYRQTVTVLHGVDRVDCTTTLQDFAGSDDLVRVRFGVPVAGALPVSEVGNAVIGRGFGLIDVDSAVHPWTLDNPAHTWFGLSATARVDLPGGHRAVGVAEVVCPDGFDVARVRPLLVALVQQGVTATTSAASGPRYGTLAVDSNLPDVRLVVGGPDRNAFARQVLDAAPGAADALAQRVKADGSAAVWVPAARTLAESWVPGADLRAPDALGALVLDAGDDAGLDALLARVVDDLAESTIGAGDDGSGRSDHEPWAGRSVGLLVRGIPGFAVTPDGALHASLVRSCTGWPSGVWIDPPRRSAPDGSAFQLQHWTHDLEYALVAGDGDWRDAGFVAAGQGFNAPLTATVTTAHAGPLPPSGALVEAGDGFVLTTLKPAGNPLASGRRPGDRVDAVTLRGYDAHGRGGAVRVRLPVGAGAARTTNLLEENGSGDELAVSGGEVTLAVGASDVATAVVDLAAPAAAAPAEEGEPVQPVPTRYWLHNAGTPPVGNLPVAVHLTPNRLAGEPGGTVTLRASVASDLVEAGFTGVAQVTAPPGWRTEPGAVPVELAPGGWDEREVTLGVPAGCAPGRYVVRIGLRDAGNDLVDEAVVTVGPAPGARGWFSGREAAASSVQADRAGLTVELAGAGDGAAGDVEVVPGGSATVTGVLTNPFASDVRVHVWAVSPYGTWDAVSPAVQGVDVPAGGTAQVAVTVAPPLDATPGHTWLLLKAAAVGDVAYSAAVRLVVRG